MFEFVWSPETIGTSLSIMGKGLVGIFAVIIIIMLFVKLMCKAFSQKKDN